jgi:hypothetical protein
MDRVKKMTKYTVLSELSRLIGQNTPIKGTYVKTLNQDDIFETPNNKTTQLYSIPSNNKMGQKILVPLVKPEAIQEGSLSESEVAKLLRNVKDARARKILLEYLSQNDELDMGIKEKSKFIQQAVITNKMSQSGSNESNESNKSNKSKAIKAQQPLMIEPDYTITELIYRMNKAKRDGNEKLALYYRMKAKELTDTVPEKSIPEPKITKPAAEKAEAKAEAKPMPAQAAADEDTVIIEDDELSAVEVEERKNKFIKDIKKVMEKFKSVAQFEKYLKDNNLDILKADLVKVGLKKLTGGMTLSLNAIRAKVKAREQAIAGAKAKAAAS